ncbi:MAG TPA: hypothetical protein VGG45_13880 [Terracidiphilus sp.]
MDQPDGDQEIDEKDRIREDQEFAEQNKPKRQVDRITAECEHAARDKFIGVIGIDADSEAPAEGYESQNNQNQTCQTKAHTGRGDGDGMKDLMFGDRRKTKRSGKHDVEIENGERRNQEIFFIDVAEVDCLNPAPLHEQGSAQYHPQKQ